MHVERADFGVRPVVPDDAKQSADTARSEGAGGIGAAELGAAARPVGLAVLADTDAAIDSPLRSGMSR